MKKLLLVIGICVLSLLVRAQSDITVTEVVYLNDEFDRVIDSVGDVGVCHNHNFGQIYYHIFYISIQTYDSSFFHNDQTQIFLYLKKSNDTIPFIQCDESLQKHGRCSTIWLMAPVSDEDLPCEKEFIIQDIVLSCNSIDTLWRNAFALICYEKEIDRFKTLGYNNFKAPYYSEDKVRYRMLCPYPTAFNKRWLKKMQILNGSSTPEPDYYFDEDLFEP